MNLQVDNSSMEAYAKCPVYYAMNRIHHFKPKEPVYYFVAGHAFHKFWELFFKGKTEQEMFAGFERELEPFKFIADPPPSHSPENLRKLAKVWLDIHRNVQWPWTPVYVEVGFKINNFIEGVDLVGRLDYLGQNKTDGAWVVKDWKTTGKLDIEWERKWRSSSQLCCYLWATQQIFKVPVWEVYVMGLEIKKIPDSDRICRGGKGQEGHGVPFSQCGHKHVKFKNLDQKLIAGKLHTWKRDASQICREIVFVNREKNNLEDIKDLHMKGMFNNGCYRCDYREWCHIYNRRADVVDTLFKREEYDPLKDAEVFEVTL